MEKRGGPTVKMLAEKRSEILEAWMKEQSAYGSLREDLMGVEEQRKQSEEFLDELVKATSSGNLADIKTPEYKGINQLLAEICASRAKRGFSPRETGNYIFSLRGPLEDLLLNQYASEPEILHREISSYNQLIDSLGTLTFEIFIVGRDELIRRQQEEILELSTPVIKIWDGVLVVPLIGTLDSARTQVVMRNLLQEIVATGSQVAILDISGVPTVDTLTAQHLLKTVSAAHLMGAECIICGIMPGIAETIVQLGIDLSQVITKATLADALKKALEMLGQYRSQPGKLPS